MIATWPVDSPTVNAGESPPEATSSMGPVRTPSAPMVKLCKAPSVFSLTALADAINQHQKESSKMGGRTRECCCSSDEV